MTTTDLASIIDAKLDDQAAAESDIARPAKTYIDAVEISKIEVDHTYQRELDRNRVTRMAAEYDPSLVGILEISARDDGTYRVIDGQHRLFMIRAAHPHGSKAHVACNIHTGLTIEQEAQLFFDMDAKRRRLTGWDRWNARRGAGEPEVLEIEAIATSNGLKVDPAPKPYNLRCVAACEKLVALAGIEVLDRTLATVVAAYEGESDSLRSEIVHGIGLILAYYADEVDQERLVHALEAITPRQITARAGALRETHPGQMPRLAASVLIDRYNSEPGKKVQPFLQRVPSASRVVPGKHGPEHRANADRLREAHARKVAARS